MVMPLLVWIVLMWPPWSKFAFVPLLVSTLTLLPLELKLWVLSFAPSLETPPRGWFPDAAVAPVPPVLVSGTALGRGATVAPVVTPGLAPATMPGLAPMVVPGLLLVGVPGCAILALVFVFAWVVAAGVEVRSTGLGGAGLGASAGLGDSAGLG